MTKAARRFCLTCCSTLIGLAYALPVDAQNDETVRIDGLEWTARTNGADVPWPDADGYCSDLDLKGHRDWRLPTLQELEALHDPVQPAGIRAPIRLEGCCLWSATSLAQLAPDDGSGVAAPSRYHWGLVFDGGIRYYSVDLQPDGRALCVRDRGNSEP